MELRPVLLLVVLACFIAAEAKTSMRRAPREGDLKVLQVKQSAAEKTLVSPEVDKSDKKFFSKDYMYDKRPSAEALHFKHPYPVVQDSNDFDKDFVKDENSDNGAWKAQEIYDRLRVKLGKEKKDLAKALAKKQTEEQEMKDAMAHHDAEELERDAAQRKADRLRREAEEAKKSKAHQAVDNVVKDVTKEAEKLNPFKPVKEVDVSTADTERALDKLENCKKELAKARQQLKDLMGDLEDAKAKQSASNDNLDKAMKIEVTEKSVMEAGKLKVKSEYDEYQEARQAYEKQQALVHQLEADIKVAAAKVKAMRDSADKDGGVYPSGHKSGASVAHCLWAALVLALASA